MSDDIEVEAAAREKLMDSQLAEDDGEVGTSKRRNSEADESRKRVRTGTVDEEKKRGKRLFGSLLGTLGGIKREASSAKSQERAARQAELERRQKERSQKAAEEMAKKQAETDALRLKRQRERETLAEVERVEALHAHKVLLAGYLMTEAEPRLSFMPWKLTREQEDRIDEQLRVAKKEQTEALRLLSTASNRDESMPDVDNCTVRMEEVQDAEKSPVVPTRSAQGDEKQEHAASDMIESRAEPAAEHSTVPAEQTSEPTEKMETEDSDPRGQDSRPEEPEPPGPSATTTGDVHVDIVETESALSINANGADLARDLPTTANDTAQTLTDLMTMQQHDTKRPEDSAPAMTSAEPADDGPPHTNE